MNKEQNIYDNNSFFNQYKKMRDFKLNANQVLEIPTIKKMMPKIKGKKVLDIGCGAGDMCKFFADNGASSVLGIDISVNMLKLAKNSTQHQNVKFLNLSMKNLLTLNKKFDVIFSSLAFHYAEDFSKLISDISKLLNDDGVLLFSQEHPIATAPIFANNISNKIEIDKKRYYLFSDYHHNGKRVVNWNVKGVIKYHRSLSVIFNALLLHNLQILQVEESKSPKESEKTIEKYKYQNDRPYFIFIKAIKKQFK